MEIGPRSNSVQRPFIRNLATVQTSREITMFTRRKFLGTTLGAAALASAGCATQPAGRRQIVDAQVHLWKASGPDYPWNPGATPQLPEPMTVERLAPLMDAAGVDRVVI